MASANQKRIPIGELASATGFSITHLRRLADEGAIQNKKSFHASYELADLREDLI